MIFEKPNTEMFFKASIPSHGNDDKKEQKLHGGMKFASRMGRKK
jgi:hypothetical protein